MKQLVLIIHHHLKQDIADLLRNTEQVQGFTLSHVEGHGKEDHLNITLSAKDEVVGYTSRIRVDILLQDADVESILTILSKSNMGLNNQAVYWTLPVEQHGKL